MERNTEHFTDDPDLLSEYVLRRLDPATLARLDEHVRACEPCREAVREERMIAATIKRYGRDQLKERIGMLTGASRSRQIPWPHVLSIAAVLLIVVGIGIYQGWFVTYVEQENMVTDAPPQEEAVTESDAANGADESTPPPQAPSRSSEPSLRQRDKEEAPLSQERGADERRSQEKNVEEPRRQEPGVNEEEKKYGYAPGAADRREESADALSKGKQRADISEPLIGSAGTQQEFWTGGTLIAGVAAKREADESRALKSVKKDEVHAAGAAQGETSAFGKVTVDQRPASKLPATLQRQQLYDRQTIQTLVRQSEGETQLTLYPVSPFDSTQLHYARVDQVAPDSLVVRIGDQKIGYRLPRGTQWQMPGDSGRARRR